MLLYIVFLCQLGHFLIHTKMCWIMSESFLFFFYNAWRCIISHNWPWILQKLLLKWSVRFMYIILSILFLLFNFIFDIILVIIIVYLIPYKKSILQCCQCSIIIYLQFAMAYIDLFSELKNSGFGSLATASDPCKRKREKIWKADMQMWKS